MAESLGRFSSLVTRLTAMVSAILVTVVLVVGSLAMVMQRRQLRQALGTKATGMVNFMAQVTPLGILSLNFVEMSNHAQKVVLTDDEAVFAVILNEQRRPLAHFFKETDPLATGEVLGLVRERKPLEAIEAMKRSGRVLEVQAPINAGTRRIGTAILGYSTLHMRRALMAQIAVIAVILAAVLASSAMLLRTVLRWDLSPVKALTAAATQASTGRLEVELSGIERRDELGVLARAFQSMAGQLGQLISGLKQRERDLHRLSMLQRAILDNVAYGIIASTPEGIVTSFNHAAEHLLGYSASEVVGHLRPDLWHLPEEMARRAEALSVELGETVAPGFEVFAARPRRGIPDEQEWTFIHKDGTRVPVLLSVTALRDEDGTLSGFVGITYDLRERKRAEEGLRQQEKELATIFENARFMLTLLDSQLRVRKINALACALTGRRASELLGRPFGDALGCKFVDEDPKGCCHGAHCFGCSVRRTMTDTLETGHNHPQTEVVHPMVVDGKEQVRSLLVSSAFVTVADSPMVLLTVQDITEYKKLEAQLLQSQKMEAIGTLAGGIAHDFNNILTAIIGFATIMRMKMAPEDPQRSALEQILSSAERAAYLTQSLLAFSRKQVINPKPTDLNGIVLNVEKLLRRIIGEDIELPTRVCEGDLTVMADSGQIEQVLMNLVANSRDAMPRGGTIAIETAKVQVDPAFVSAHGFGRPGNFALITVADNGSGMDEATRSKIFEPFFTTKEQGKGTGLGLAIVYGIVNQHGGHISVYSEPGAGTTFRIYLPLVAAPAPSVPPPGAVVPRGGDEIILLAEDDKDVRKLTRIILEDFGYHILEAVDGQEAIDQFRSHSAEIDLVLADVVMPKFSGLDFYRAAREIRPGIKIIFTSGYPAGIIHAKGTLDEGVNYLPKPVSPVDLLKMVREVLDTRR